MKNIFLLISFFLSTYLCSTHEDSDGIKQPPLIDLKSHCRYSENLTLHNLFKLIKEPNKEKLQAFLQKLDTYHLKNRILMAVDHETHLTPLYYALAQDFNNYFTIELLLSHGSDPNKQTNHKAQSCHKEPLVLPKGSTVAHIAIITKKPVEILQLLKQHGCDFGDHVKDAHGHTPLGVAEKHENQVAKDFINATKRIRRVSSSSNLHQLQTGENGPQFIEFQIYDGLLMRVQPQPPSLPMAKDDDDTKVDCCCYRVRWLLNKALQCSHCCDHDD